MKPCKLFFGFLLLFFQPGFADCGDSLVELIEDTPNPHYKEILAYNSAGRLVSASHYEISTSGWSLTSCKKYTYDANGNKLSYSSESGFPAPNKSLDLFTYDAADSIATKESYYSASGGALLPNQKKTIIYNIHHRDSMDIFQSWVQQNWVNSFRYTFSYDSLGVRNYPYKEYWDGAASAWVPYAQQGDPSLIDYSDTIVTQEYNPIDSMMENKYRWITNYTGSNRQTEKILQGWHSTFFRDSVRIVTRRDNAGRQTYWNYYVNECNPGSTCTGWYMEDYYDSTTYTPDGKRSTVLRQYYYGSRDWTNFYYNAQGFLYQYVSNYTTMGGILTTTTHNFLFNSLGIPIYGNNAICGGTTTILSTDSSCSSNTYSWSNGSHTPSILVTNPGYYRVTVTDSNGVSKASKWLQVTITPPPNLFSGSDSSISVCPNGSVLLKNVNDPGSTYLWFRNDTAISYQTYSNLNLGSGFQLRAGNYYLVATNQCGIDTSSQTTVNLLPAPINAPILSSGTTTPNSSYFFCDGDSITLSTTSIGNFLWSPGNDTNSFKVVKTSGYYTLKTSNQFGCYVTRGVNVNKVNFPIIPVITRYQNTLQSTSYYNSQWFFNGDSIFGAISTNYQPTQNGYYSVAAKNVNCSSFSSLFFYNDSVLGVEAGSTTYACLNSTVGIGPFGTAAYGGHPPYRYKWFPSAHIRNDTLSRAILDSVTASQTYYLTVTDSSGATYTDSMNLILDIPAKPIITVSSSYGVPFCENSGNKLRVAGNVNVVKWIYNGSTIVLSLPQVSYPQSGVYQVVIKNGNNCENISDPFTFIELPAPPQPVIQGITNCQTNGTLYVHPLPGLSYSWYEENSLVSSDTSTITHVQKDYKVVAADSNGCTSSSIIIWNSSEGYFFYCNQSAERVCSGDSVTITAPYVSGATYQWYLNNTLVPSATSNILVTNAAYRYNNSCRIIDANGCIANGSFYLDTSTSASVSIHLTDSILYSNVSQSGTSYQWYFNDTPMPLAVGPTLAATLAGTYKVRAENKWGCGIFSNSISFGCSAAISSSRNIVCKSQCDASLSLSTFGFPPFNYLWSRGDSTAQLLDACAGNYFVQVIDSVGCIAFDSITIYENNLSLGLSKTDVTCFQQCNGFINAEVTPGSLPYNYSWNTNDTLPSLQDLCPGIYQLTVSDTAGCSVKDSVQITEPAQLQLTTQKQNPSCAGCPDGIIYISHSGGIPPFTLSWTPNTGVINGDTISALITGTYSVCIYDSLNCSVCVIDTLQTPTSDNDLNHSAAVLEVFPNPAKDHLILRFHSLKGSIKIENMTGQLMYASELKEVIDISLFPAGTYILKIKTPVSLLIKSFVKE